MSRLTTPTRQFTRAISLQATSLSRPTVTDLHHTGLSPKYAELLSTEDQTRGLRTTHKPNHRLPRVRPLMQTFSAHASTSTTGPRHIDSTVMPTLPDTEKTEALAGDAGPADKKNPELLVVATDPSLVQTATPLMEVKSRTDAPELKR